MNTQHAIRTAACVIPLCASLLSNHTPSGVGLTKQFLARQAVLVKNQVDTTNPNTTIADQTKTTFEQLEQIRNTFALKISELSEIFNASRPTIYAWLNGSSPKDSSSIDKISYIAQVSRRFASLSFTKPEAILKRPVLTGNRTLLQCLVDNIEVSDEELRILHRIDQKEATKRAEPKLTHKRHNDIESMITPIINNLV